MEKISLGVTHWWSWSLLPYEVITGWQCTVHCEERHLTWLPGSFGRQTKDISFGHFVNNSGRSQIFLCVARLDSLTKWLLQWKSSLSSNINWLCLEVPTPDERGSTARVALPVCRVFSPEMPMIKTGKLIGAQLWESATIGKRSPWTLVSHCPVRKTPLSSTPLPRPRSLPMWKKCMLFGKRWWHFFRNRW